MLGETKLNTRGLGFDTEWCTEDRGALRLLVVGLKGIKEALKESE